MFIEKDQISHLAALVKKQEVYERSVINLIASDNARPIANLTTPLYLGDMIQEGIAGDRPFAGATHHDEIEFFASQIACQIFGAEHANVQPHSCSQANQAVLHALLNNGDTVLSLGFKSGGHLTHGFKKNFSGRCYEFKFYGVGDDELIDYDELELMAKLYRPKLIICGSSAYTRMYDVSRLRQVADQYGCKLMLDLSHEAGLIAANVMSNDISTADVVTMSLDKTLRGPFGGLILCKKYLASTIDQAVHPGTQSSFPIRKIIDAAHSMLSTQTEDFTRYANRAINNAKYLEKELLQRGACLLAGGTDKHYIIIKTRYYGKSGLEAERLLESVGILSSRQAIPTDITTKMSESSGIRIGTAWTASRGYRPEHMKEVVDIIDRVLNAGKLSNRAIQQLKQRAIEVIKIKRQDDCWNTKSDDAYTF